MADFWCRKCNGKWPRLEDYHAHSCVDTPNLLDQRGATHGDYRAMSTRIQQIKSVMRMGSKWIDMSEPQKEALELIATKIGRIIEGDPEHLDHWQDLSGYAIKASEFCRKEPTSA